MSELHQSVRSQISITLAWSTAGAAQEVCVQIASGTALGTLKSCVEFVSQIPTGTLNAAAGIGVWGRARTNTYKLRDGDRVEIYAPLKIDPKEQRRKRAR